MVGWVPGFHSVDILFLMEGYTCTQISNTHNYLIHLRARTLRKAIIMLLETAGVSLWSFDPCPKVLTHAFPAGDKAYDGVLCTFTTIT